MRSFLARSSSCLLLVLLVGCGADTVAPTDDELRPTNLALSVTLQGQPASELGPLKAVPPPTKGPAPSSEVYPSKST